MDFNAPNPESVFKLHVYEDYISKSVFLILFCLDLRKPTLDLCMYFYGHNMLKFRIVLSVMSFQHDRPRIK